MLEFYEFNSINICVLFISIFIIYTILEKFEINKKKNKDEINIENLLISCGLSIIISIGFAYFYTGSDEKLLDDNYWDALNESP